MAMAKAAKRDGNAITDLEKRIKERPDRKDLKEKGILPEDGVDPAIQSARNTLRKKQAADALKSSLKEPTTSDGTDPNISSLKAGLKKKEDIPEKPREETPQKGPEFLSKRNTLKKNDAEAIKAAVRATMAEQTELDKKLSKQQEKAEAGLKN
jgi:hypothetical protein